MFFGGDIYVDPLENSLSVIFCTIGDGLSSIIVRLGMSSLRFNNFDISKIEFLTSSPAFSDATVVGGGFDRMDMMSVAAC